VAAACGGAFTLADLQEVRDRKRANMKRGGSESFIGNVL
jgi:hypothetical protein